MVSVQLMVELWIHLLTSVALNQALVVGLVSGDCGVPDVLQQVRLVRLELLLLLDVINTVQFLKYKYSYS